MLEKESIKKQNILKRALFYFQMFLFFKFDKFFWNKINIDIKTLYRACKSAEINFISHDKKNKTLRFLYKGKHRLVTDYSVGTLVQIFAFNTYSIPEYFANSEFIVVDMGMNKGFSPIWFSLMPNVKKVVGFEIDPRLKPYIKENIKTNALFDKKIITHNYGLSDKDTSTELIFLAQDDGITTIETDFYRNYWSPKRKSGANRKIVKVRKSSTIIKKYFEKFKNSSFLLKIDVEGSEYKIIPDLYKNDQLARFDIIMGETHSGFDKIEEYLGDFFIVDLQDFGSNLNTFLAINNKYEEEYKIFKR